jgi:hypothetical protein
MTDSAKLFNWVFDFSGSPKKKTCSWNLWLGIFNSCSYLFSNHPASMTRTITSTVQHWMDERDEGGHVKILVRQALR